jgi:uncharacterized protein (TIGR02118 family)
MHRVLALYPRPKDPEHFRGYYQSTHIPIVKKLPGLKSFRYSLDVAAMEGDAPYFCIAELEFESAEAMAAAVNTPEGKAVVDDVPKYASGGITLLHYDLKE